MLLTLILLMILRSFDLSVLTRSKNLTVTAQHSSLCTDATVFGHNGFHCTVASGGFTKNVLRFLNFSCCYQLMPEDFERQYGCT